MVQWFAVHADLSRVGFLADVARDGIADGHSTPGHPETGFAAGAVAEVGEELVEAAHGQGAQDEDG